MSERLQQNAAAKTKRTYALVVSAAVLVCVGLLCGCGSMSKDTQSGEASGQLVDEAQVRIQEQLDALDEARTEPRPKHAEKESADEVTVLEPPTIEPLQQQLEDYASQSGMQVCVSVIDLTDGSVASCNGDVALPSASMIKLLVAYAFLEQVQAGTQSLDAPYTLQYTDLVGGSGSLIGLGAGATITYRDALMRMIDASDNVGANILIDAVGMEVINASAEELGLVGTQLNRRMMDEAAIAAGIDNYTCAYDLAQLLQMVFEGSFVDSASSGIVLQALEQQEDRGGIRSGLPEGTVFAHKTGALATVCHDGGIVEGEHPYVLVVLCGGDGFYPGGAYQAMSDIATLVNDALTQ